MMIQYGWVPRGPHLQGLKKVFQPKFLWGYNAVFPIISMRKVQAWVLQNQQILELGGGCAAEHCEEPE